MERQQLILEILHVSYKIHPEYSKNQHWAWTAGILADTVLAKNHMDSVVYARLNHRLNQLLDQPKYRTDGAKGPAVR